MTRTGAKRPSSTENNQCIYCTVSVNVVVFCSGDVPLVVALTVTVLVPGSVPGFEGVLLPPPQASHNAGKPKTTINASKRKPRRVRLRPDRETTPRNPGSNRA